MGTNEPDSHLGTNHSSNTGLDIIGSLRVGKNVISTFSSHGKDESPSSISNNVTRNTAISGKGDFVVEGSVITDFSGGEGNLGRSSNKPTISIDEVGSSGRSSRKNEKAYDVKGAGSVLIINNKFDAKAKSLGFASRNHLERKGTEKDADEIEALLKDVLGCTVYVEENVKSTDLGEILEGFKNASKDSGFCMTIIMTHGGDSEFSLLMDDLKEINVYNDLVYPFSEDNFTDFRGKPKIFLIQACAKYSTDQKIASDGATDLVQDECGSTDPPPPPPPGELADTFIGKSCLPYRVSWRNVKSGSWYIQSLKKVIETSWKFEDLETMHKMVGGEVAKRGMAANEQIKVGDKLTLQTPYVINVAFEKFYFPHL